jgi:ParB family transcriptional regulator, chromosome partitioning protein
MEIINRKVSELIPYERNPRKNDEAVKYVKASIEQFGFKVPIVIDAHGVIVAGHTRLKAAKELGMKEVPCIVADDLNEEQIRAFRVADNKTGEMAEWNIELLNTELLDLEANFDMSDFGFEINPPTGYVPGEEPGSQSAFNYKEQYGVIVICADEGEQEKIYNALSGDGYNCRVVAT